jgi:hypothetical protein
VVDEKGGEVVGEEAAPAWGRTDGGRKERRGQRRMRKERRCFDRKLGLAPTWIISGYDFVCRSSFLQRSPLALTQIIFGKLPLMLDSGRVRYYG